MHTYSIVENSVVVITQQGAPHTTNKWYIHTQNCRVRQYSLILYTQNMHTEWKM